VQGSERTAETFVSAAGSDLFSPLAGLVETVPSYHDYLGGSSYLEALYFPIPRALWPAKPLGSILTLTASFADIRNGESFPEYGEMYANFGVVGVILGCILFGAVLEWMWSRFAAGTGRGGLFVYPALIAISLQLFTRDYAVSQTAGLLGFLLGAILVQRTLQFEALRRTIGTPKGAGVAQHSLTPGAYVSADSGR
jgi:oligosaccharide repeat unit polymerase